MKMRSGCGGCRGAGLRRPLQARKSLPTSLPPPSLGRLVSLPRLSSALYLMTPKHLALTPLCYVTPTRTSPQVWRDTSDVLASRRRITIKRNVDWAAPQAPMSQSAAVTPKP